MLAPEGWVLRVRVTIVVRLELRLRLVVRGGEGLHRAVREGDGDRADAGAGVRGVAGGAALAVRGAAAKCRRTASSEGSSLQVPGVPGHECTDGSLCCEGWPARPASLSASRVSLGGGVAVDTGRSQSVSVIVPAFSPSWTIRTG